MVAAVELHLGDMVEYVIPKAGMFLWMKLKGVEDSNYLIMEKVRGFEKERRGDKGCVRISVSSPIIPLFRLALLVAIAVNSGTVLSAICPIPSELASLFAGS